jgi:predicted glycogen debranching enzyme
MTKRPPSVPDLEAEWLEPDGLGGFASGTVGGVRTRRYHAVLLAARHPPAERMALVGGLDAWVETPRGRFDITSQRYRPGVIAPDGGRRLEAFSSRPWPRWSFVLDDGTRVEQELFVPKGSAMTVVTWRAAGAPAGTRLTVRPFLSGRGYHALHHENGDFRFEAEVNGERVVWRPYADVPGIVALSNGAYRHEPHWYRGFVYEEERRRGLDFEEDLAAPGTLTFDLAQGDAQIVLAAHLAGEPLPLDGQRAAAVVAEMRAAEGHRRSTFVSALHRAADAYVVRRGAGQTIVAGYPWFTDWGRDTFVAMRGICLAGGRLDDARAILLEWARAASEGMLPNRFADHGDAPEFNAVDASLWYVIAVHEYLGAAAAVGRPAPSADRRRLQCAVESILDTCAAGTRHGIRLDRDGLLAAGEPGVPLTWMDARVGDRVVTPRIGKPVEVQALWLNAVTIGSTFSERWPKILADGRRSFRERFWNPAAGALHDVVDPDHRAGTVDASFRPNQILAVGGLPFGLLEPAMARRVVDAVEARLWTPLGLRTLAADEPGYAPRCQGGVQERDGAYHQGAAWPWLLGPFVEAWVRVRGATLEARREARTRFLDPLMRHLEEGGLGHVSEIVDGDAPHTPRGCPFQAWSVGEALRLDRLVLGDDSRRPLSVSAPGAKAAFTTSVKGAFRARPDIGLDRESKL